MGQAQEANSIIPVVVKADTLLIPVGESMLAVKGSHMLRHYGSWGSRAGGRGEAAL